MSLVHRPRKHHHHHSPNRIETLSTNFNRTLEKVKELEEEIVRIKEGPKPTVREVTGGFWKETITE